MKYLKLVNQAFKKSRLLVAACFMLSLISSSVFAQTLPYEITNRSPYPDDQVYVAIVGITDGHVWVDPTNGQVRPMDPSYNTVQGPVIGGNKGPGNNAMYANCFRRLSEIPNRTINIPQIAGCRILISFQSQLFLYFFGHSGAVQGYSAPALENPTDPNQGIKYDIVELTYNQYGLWCNTSRVDNYQYPMGLEVWGDNFYKRVGELKTHQEIINEWKATAPAEFSGILNESEGMIQFPAKNPNFPKNFFDGYINDIWNKYRSDELVFYSGQAGTWRGRVQGDAFVFTRDRDGQVATIPGKPSTEEAMEGSGNLATGSEADKVVQAQFVAAITRHALDLNVPSGVLQDFGDVSKYYQTWPYNWYSAFFHRNDISVDSKTYTFAYDDVFDQSATIHTPAPSSIKITIGGFAGLDPTDPNPPTGGNGVTGLSGTYTLKNRQSGLVMDVAENGNTANGTNILQWNATGSTNQQFVLNEVSSGIYTMTCVKTGKVADIDGASTANFANLHQWEYAGGDNQKFKIEDAGNGYYKLRAVHSGRILEVAYASLEAGANIGQYDDNGQLCAHWQLVAVGGGNSWSKTIEAESYGSMSGVEKEACSEGGESVGYIETGDWMAYTAIDFPSSGSYKIEYRVASETGGGVISADLNAGATVLGTVNVPATGGWQTWTTVSHTVNIPAAGTQNLGLYAQNGGWNINWLKITKVGAGARTAAVEVAEKANEVAVYPNPATETVTVKGADLEGASLSIIDKTGKEVYSSKFNGKSVDVSNLPADIYIIRINKGDTQVIQRFIKK